MKNSSIEIKWAIIFTVVALLWMVLEKVLGWHENIEQHMVLTNLFSIVAIALYVFALRDKKRALGGKMSWKQGFLSGALLSLFIAVLTPLSQYITHNIISPEYFQNAIDFSVENGKSTQEKAEAYFSLKSYMIQSSVFALIIGLITSAIVSLFVRSK